MKILALRIGDRRRTGPLQTWQFGGRSPIDWPLAQSARVFFFPLTPAGLTQLTDPSRAWPHLHLPEAQGCFQHGGRFQDLARQKLQRTGSDSSSLKEGE